MRGLRGSSTNIYIPGNGMTARHADDVQVTDR